MYAVPLKYPEPVHLCEARGLLSVVKHLSRDKNNHGRMHIVIGDNMGVALAASKGRASCYPLLRILQSITAECLAADLLCCRRWLPPERNHADFLSRLWEPGGVLCDEAFRETPHRLPRHVLRQLWTRRRAARPECSGAPRAVEARSADFGGLAEEIEDDGCDLVGAALGSGCCQSSVQTGTRFDAAGPPGLPAPHE